MSPDLEDLAQSILDAATAAGAEAADAMVVDGQSLSVDVRGSALEHAERSESIDLGLRVLVGQRQAIVSVSDTKPATVAAMAERAVAMAREAPDDPYAGLADATDLATDTSSAALDLADPGPEPGAGALRDMALAAEAAALDVPGVTQVESANGSYGRSRVFLAATNGFSGGYARTGTSVSCISIAGEGTGMERDYDADSRTYSSDLRRPEEIGRRAGERAVAHIGARQPETGTFPVLFDERIAGSLIGHLLSAVNGAAIARGASWLMDALGEPVLPGDLSLIEDPLRPRISGSRAFDAEGIQTRRRAIVEDGRLTGWTLDLASARKLGMSSTGNASRGPSSPPSPSNWNVTLTPGKQGRDEIMRDMGTGLLVTSMIGATINPNTGDYSRGASGFWIEAGEIAYPVNECTIAGNLRDMMLRILPANDARQYLSRVVPSLMIDGMTLAGR